MNGARISVTTIVLAVVSLALIAAGLFFGLAVTNHLDSESTPILTVVLGFLATTITSIIALGKVDSISHDLRNGLIENKVGNAIDNKQVITRDGPAVTTTMAALIKLLEVNGVVDPSKTSQVMSEQETIRKEANDGRPTV